MDIRVPIGMMFSILGVILAAYGIFTFSEAELYKRSLGINVNLWWGVVQLAFGAIMLYYGRRAERELAGKIARGEITIDPNEPPRGHGH